MNGRAAKRERRKQRMLHQSVRRHQFRVGKRDAAWSKAAGSVWEHWPIKTEGLTVRPHLAFNVYVAQGPLSPRLASTVSQSGYTADELYTYRDAILEPCGGEPESAEHAWELTVAFMEQVDALGHEYAGALYGELVPCPFTFGKFVWGRDIWSGPAVPVNTP